jgi:hypothetical protein
MTASATIPPALTPVLAREIQASDLVLEQGGDLIEQRVAVFDAALTYRYLLAVRWSAAPAAVFVMLNPSTADAHENDPTLRRALGFARRERCGALVVVNLFALRATDPDTLAGHPDPVGPANDAILAAAVGGAELVIAAWGAGGILHHRDQAVMRLLAPTHWSCLGHTRGGQPRHPLYLPATAALVDYGAAAISERIELPTGLFDALRTACQERDLPAWAAAAPGLLAAAVRELLAAHEAGSRRLSAENAYRLAQHLTAIYADGGGPPPAEEQLFWDVYDLISPAEIARLERQADQECHEARAEFLAEQQGTSSPPSSHGYANEQQHLAPLVGPDPPAVGGVPGDLVALELEHQAAKADYQRRRHSDLGTCGYQAYRLGRQVATHPWLTAYRAGPPRRAARAQLRAAVKAAQTEAAAP